MIYLPCFFLELHIKVRIIVNHHILFLWYHLVKWLNSSVLIKNLQQQNKIKFSFAYFLFIQRMKIKTSLIFKKGICKSSLPSGLDVSCGKQCSFNFFTESVIGIVTLKILRNVPQILTIVTLMPTVPIPKAHSTALVTMVSQETESSAKVI